MTMTPERWAQVGEVLHRALQVAPEKQAAFLDGACESDESLRREVESLLAADDQARSTFLQSLPALGLGKGDRVGEYEIQSLLGAGGMGEVYRARDLRLRRDVAIKVLPAFVSFDPERLRRFEQEAMAAAALNHPNILAVYQMGTYEGALYLVSELLEGETLREQIRRGRIAVGKAIDYAVQMARGVAAAHEKGIVHRDLKPENLFVTKDGTVKILDFGLAKLSQPQPGSANSALTAVEQTEPGKVMGTAGYMSPEQVRGQAADRRADIFAFGAVLYEMLTGERAFQKPTSPETMSAILNDEPSAISQFVPNFPAALQRVVRRCLEKNLERRFQSAADLAFALEALSDSGSYSSTDVSRARLHRDRAFWGVVATAASVALVFAGVVFLAWHSRTSDATPIHSIAVLPFSNAGKDPEMDYLGEGISEEITNSLSRLPNLQVMARSTVSRYKSRQDDPQGVGHDLHVDAVLTGRVLEHGSELDVETELVNVATGAQLWGERYTRNAGDVALLQSSLLSDVAAQLRPQLAGVQRERLAKVGTQNSEAYQLYLKGRYHYDRYTKEDFKAAVGFFERAVTLDPNYAAAYAWLAMTYAMQGYRGYVPSREVFNQSRKAARRALELDSEIPESHISLALVDSLIFWDFAEAKASLEKALALDPNSALAHDVSCVFAYEMGKISEGIAECRKAVELDPLSPLFNYDLANAYYLARQYDQSLQQARRTLEIDPRYSEAIKTIGYVYELTGNYKGAIEQWIKNEQVLGNERRAKELRAVFEKAGYRGYLRKDANDKEAEGDYYDAACDYALLGAKDAALRAVERAVAAGQQVDYIKLDPDLDDVRSDPRYTDLLRRIGLPE